MVHGRWVPDPGSMTIANVLLSADAGEQRTVAYALSDLEQIERDVSQLHRDLSKLVMRREL
jgi:hypothetical protein